MGQWYWYEPLGEGNVRLLRVFGSDARVTVPSVIAGGRVTEIGEYCFAAHRQRKAYSICSDSLFFPGENDEQAFLHWCSEEGLRPLAGRDVAFVELPETLEKLGDYAFYQCGELREMSLGMGEMEVGGDAFMNCRRLSVFYFRGHPGERCCLRQILARRREETQVYFQQGGEILAALLFPEYIESYDLIGPAHIFSLNIQGEGFRARQCFRDGAVDLSAYDQIFSREWGEESQETLCRMACNRLEYPLGLQERERRAYEDYVRSHRETACRRLVEEKDFFGLQRLYRAGLLDGGQLRQCLAWAVEAKWTEGVRQILSLEEKEETAYGFEDF